MAILRNKMSQDLFDKIDKGLIRELELVTL
jgi:hypothetical protein